MTTSNTPRCPFEHIAEKENEQVDEITDITVKLLDKRYTNKGKPILRGVHPKSHGCVKANFKINDDIDESLRVGLFAEPGKQFDAFIRFSNAAAVLGPDTTEIDPRTNEEVEEHGSRGMAIKVLDVGGEVLTDDNGAHNQDFLMINQPMFAFANTEDYLRLEKVLDRDNDVAGGFFAPLFVPDPSVNDGQKQRIANTLKIVKDDIQKTDVGNALGIQYFSAAPFLFGLDRVMKFSAKPCTEVPPAQSPPRPRPENYLRDALTETMSEDGDLHFDFMLQVRCEGDDFGIDNELIENASSEWKEDFVPVAKITILAPQSEVDSDENKAHCEKLAFTPWHSLTEHQPIGSINRLRKSVYQASADHRNRGGQNGSKGSLLWAIPLTAIFIMLLLSLSGCNNTSQTSDPVEPPKPTKDVVFLEQGLSNDDRLAFYSFTQGSQLLPYYWFIALETSDDQSLFISDNNMRKLGYIPQTKDPGMNPDGLPIGFVKSDDPATVSYEIKKEFLGPEYDVNLYPPTNAWLGVTCANCHTSEITYQGQTLRIDGGSSQADHQAFLEQFVAAIQATTSSPEKMTRFAHRVLDPNWSLGEQNALQQRVEAYAPVLAKLTEQNKTQLVYGPGRLDAFGAIFNRVLETGLEIPANHFPSDAPVSYPFLWDTTRLDWVQYNSLGANPIARNVGEVLGVYAHLQLKGTPATGQFNSTANIRNLDRLEGYVSQLKAPSWPVKVLGEIDLEKAASGKQLYAQNCVQCHYIRDANGNFPMTTENRDMSGNPSSVQFIKTNSAMPLAELGTDPKMVQNALQFKADPGVLRPLLPEEMRNADKLPRVVILKVAVRKAIERKIGELGLEGQALQELVFRFKRTAYPAICRTITSYSFHLQSSAARRYLGNRAFLT